MSAPAVGAIPITEVVCPPWCTVSQDEHIADLPNWEGRAIHWSTVAGNGWRCDTA